MHKIIWDLGMVSMLTNSIDSTTHKHWMLQLFFEPQGNRMLTVNGIPVAGKCIVVNTNCNHTFCTSEVLHFSMLIIPGTHLCDYLVNTYINNQDYYDFSAAVDDKVTDAYEQFVQNPILEEYLRFRNVLLRSWGVPFHPLLTEQDERIHQMIWSLTADMDEADSIDIDRMPPSIENLAKFVSLSPSRLAHLFKQETGVPLKSYLVFIKVYHAFLMLLDGTSVTDAALNAGFDSPSHLAATVKGMMGTSASFAIKDSEFLKVPAELIY